MKPKERIIQNTMYEIAKRTTYTPNTHVMKKLEKDLESMTQSAIWNLQVIILEMPEREVKR